MHAIRWVLVQACFSLAWDTLQPFRPKKLQLQLLQKWRCYLQRIRYVPVYWLTCRIFCTGSEWTREEAEPLCWTDLVSRVAYNASPRSHNRPIDTHCAPIQPNLQTKKEFQKRRRPFWIGLFLPETDMAMVLRLAAACCCCWAAAAAAAAAAPLVVILTLTQYPTLKYGAQNWMK